MNDLDWLIGLRCQSFVRREYDWVLVFEKDTSLVVTCLWRILESGRIRRTSQDDGHQFGLPAPVDAASEVNGLLAHQFVNAVELRAGTLDLEIRFDSGHALQIIPDSAGYEAWTLSHGSRQFIAVGGGDLSVWNMPGRE